MNIVIDSSVLVGVLVPNDKWHQQAVAVRDAIKQTGHTAIYFDCVISETTSVALRRLYE